jgi:crotonobetainyl-CoA:carnitine CoA-transferase CaiB-like acyl-CoA transferase
MKDDEGQETREAAYYQSTNRNKLSVAIDIANPEGQHSSGTFKIPMWSLKTTKLVL